MTGGAGEHRYAEIAGGESIMDLYDRYARENVKGISADTLTQARRDVKLFADSTGNIPAAKITRRHVSDWKALLMKWPVKAAEIAVFRGMTMRQVIKKNETVGKPTISDRTVNRHLSAVGAFCDWLVFRRVLDRNPTVGLQQVLDGYKRSTLPFSVNQLNALFASPLFTCCQSDEAPRFWARPGSVKVRDHRYWIPLLILYSGAKPGELAQLAVSDIRQEQGVWIFRFSDEGKGGASVTPRGSMRAVPVHRELVALGFIECLENLKAAGEARLFPGAVRNQRGQMIADFDKNFGIYLTRLKIKKGRGLSLYSLRHNVTDALRRAGYRDEQFGFMLGHASAIKATRYGVMPEGMLDWRVELVNSITYPGLDLSRLKST